MRTKITTCDMCGKEIGKTDYGLNGTHKEHTNEDVYDLQINKSSSYRDMAFEANLCTKCYLKVKGFIAKGGE